MDPILQDLVKRLDTISGQLQELRDGVKQAAIIAELDPEMALTRARKVLEFVIRDMYQRHIAEEPGTRPLDNILQRLVKDGHLPRRLAAYANAVRELGNVGTHGFGEGVTTSDVAQSLAQLTLILEWYFTHERPPQAPATAPTANALTRPTEPLPAGPTLNPTPGIASSSGPAGGRRNPAARCAGLVAGVAFLAVGAGTSWWLIHSTRSSFPQPGPSAKDETVMALPGSALKKTDREAGDSSTGAGPGPKPRAAGPAPAEVGKAATETSDLKFQTVTSEKGGFAVEMPGVPKEETEPLPTGDEEHTFAVVLPGPKVYRVKYLDNKGFDTDPRNAQIMLKVFRNGFREGAVFEGDREITLGEDKIPGREYQLEKEKGVYVRERLFLVGHRIYTLHVVSAGDKEYLGSSPVARFFESFRIVR